MVWRMTDHSWPYGADEGFEVGSNPALAAAAEARPRLIMADAADDQGLSTYDLNMLRMEQLNEEQGGVADGFLGSLYEGGGDSP